MSHKHLLVQSAAREKILRGVQALADAVRVTIGPRSNCVLIEKKSSRPIVCNDGVTIAREFDLDDHDANVGAQIIGEAAERTAAAVGDGATTSTLLAAAIFTEGARKVAAGASAVELKRGLDRGLTVVNTALKALSRPARDYAVIAQVATVSAHNDAAIGEVVADALDRVGVDGLTAVEEGASGETTVDVVDGMRMERGLLSPHFVTDAARARTVLDDVAVLLCARRISDANQLLPALALAAKTRKSLLVVAEQIDGEALTTLVLNKTRGMMPCAAVKAPGYGDERSAMLEDIAVLTGGRVISDEFGVTLQAVSAADLGHARRIVADRDATTIVGGGGAKDAIAERASDIRARLRAPETDYDREQLERRLDALTGGVAVIRVGGHSDVDVKHRCDAFEDAVRATQAAIAEGVVPGGGLALLRAIDAVEADAASCGGDVRAGMIVLRDALEAPARQIAENSGADPAMVVREMRNGSGSYGFDASRGCFTELAPAGIVDPTKVVRVALEHAVSVAGVLLLTSATLTEASGPGAVVAEPAHAGR